ncbi:DUF6531 domain-containing protein [Streptomyces parvus]|uniref:DUF6531 domain-containing protein n=1 Tax=Streptomyces parvus TaxID=66428 RepID=UPI0037F525F3
MRDENGKPVTEPGITAIPIDRPPFPLPKNSVVPVYFTVQPGGTYVFPDGAQVIYPNYTEEAPGTRVEFMDYDPKKKGWYVYGHGRVSADGRQVVPDADTRVGAFHGAMFNIGDLVPWATSWLQDALDRLSGDPVRLGTGMLTDSRTDLAVADWRGPADVTRTYWQGDTRKRAFGIGRDLSYNAFLHSEKQYQEVDLYLPGGSKVHFTRTSPGTGYRDAVLEPLDTPSSFRGSKIVNANGMWELQLRDGTVWVFPQYSPLKEIRDRHGNTLSLERLSGSKGEITRIVTSGGRWISLAYDAEHRVKEANDNTGRTVVYTYDGSGRLETVTDPAGHVARYTYDGTSNRIATATDARGITYMTNSFDTDGRVENQILTEGATYAFAYTESSTGRITATEVTQPGGAVRRVAFDAKGFGTLDTEAHGTDLAHTTSYERDEHHRVSAVTDPHGRRTELSYDAEYDLLGRMKRARHGVDATGSADATATYTYDAVDLLKQITDTESGTQSFTYDALDRLRSTTGPTGTVGYAYDDADRRPRMTAAGLTTAYAYDRSSVLTSITSGTRSVTFAPDATGRIKQTDLPGGITRTTGYDKTGAITSLSYNRGGTKVGDLAYTRDARGLQSRLTGSLAQITLPAPARHPQRENHRPSTTGAPSGIRTPRTTPSPTPKAPSWDCSSARSGIRPSFTWAGSGGCRSTFRKAATEAPATAGTPGRRASTHYASTGSGRAWDTAWPRSSASKGAASRPSSPPGASCDAGRACWSRRGRTEGPVRSEPESMSRLRSSEFGVGLVGLCFSVALGFFLVAVQPAGETLPLWQRSLHGLPWSLALGYPAWLQLRCRVVLGKDGLLMHNRLTDVSVPYGLVQRILTSDGLGVELKDGRVLRSPAVASSLSGRLGGYQSAKKFRRAVQPRLTPADPAPAGLDIERHVQLSWAFFPAMTAVHGLWYLLLLAVES